MFRLGLKIRLNLIKQIEGSTVGKAIVEFHAQNICPVMCQVFRWNEHRGFINVIFEGSGVGHCPQWGKPVPSSPGCKSPERSG